MFTDREPIHSEGSKTPRNSIEELYRSWGVFDSLHGTIDQLPKDWLVVMNIARNLLDGKPIPGVQIPDALHALTERNVTLEYEKRLVTRSWQEAVEFPSDQIDIRPIETLTELPRILPPALLLADIEPDLFVYNAASGNLPVIEYQKPKVVMEDHSEEVEELEEVRKTGHSMRQKVYVLLDQSGSMEDQHKLTFAKAIVLAYLAKAYEEDAQLYLRAFAKKVYSRIDCTIPNEFPPLAEYVFGIHLMSTMRRRFLSSIAPRPIEPTQRTEIIGTDTGMALNTAMDDVEEIDELSDEQNALTEILLITDGASHTSIPYIPSYIALHTLHLQGGKEVEYDSTLTLAQYQKSVFALRERSRTYTIIDTSRLKPPLSEEDPKILNEESQRLEQEFEARGTEASKKDQDFQDQIEKAREMSEAYRKMYPRNKDLKEAGQRVKEMQQKLDPNGIKEALRQAIKNVFQRMRIKGRPQQKVEMRKIPSIQIPSKPSGSLFDFRIKRD